MLSFLVEGKYLLDKKGKGDDNEENIWIRKIFCLREGKEKRGEKRKFHQIGFIWSKKAKNVIVGLQP